MKSYTFFVPKDSAFVNLLPQDMADPFIIDAEFRRDILLNHFVRQRIYDRDLVDGKVLKMANDQTATITRKNINDAVIEEDDIFIYNLGTVFLIDRVLFANQDRINQVLTKHAGEIQSFASFSDGITDKPPALLDSDSTVVVDLVAELLSATTATPDA